MGIILGNNDILYILTFVLESHWLFRQQPEQSNAKTTKEQPSPPASKFNRYIVLSVETTR